MATLALLTWMEAGLSVFSWLILLGVVIAYAPLILLAVRFKAGARELQEV